MKNGTFSVLVVVWPYEHNQSAVENAPVSFGDLSQAIDECPVVVFEDVDPALLPSPQCSSSPHCDSCCREERPLSPSLPRPLPHVRLATRVRSHANADVMMSSWRWAICPAFDTVGRVEAGRYIGLVSIQLVGTTVPRDGSRSSESPRGGPPPCIVPRWESATPSFAGENGRSRSRFDVRCECARLPPYLLR